jgi:hypothetical protein
VGSRLRANNTARRSPEESNEKPPATSYQHCRGLEIMLLAYNRALRYLAHHPLTADQRAQLTEVVQLHRISGGSQAEAECERRTHQAARRNLQPGCPPAVNLQLAERGHCRRASARWWP